MWPQHLAFLSRDWSILTWNSRFFHDLNWKTNDLQWWAWTFAFFRPSKMRKWEKFYKLNKGLKHVKQNISFILSGTLYICRVETSFFLSLNMFTYCNKKIILCSSNMTLYLTWKVLKTPCSLMKFIHGKFMVKPIIVLPELHSYFIFVTLKNSTAI